MGNYTLAQFRDRLQKTLGNKGFTDPELDVWINAGYAEVSGAVQFEFAYPSIASVNIAEGTSEGVGLDALASIESVTIDEEGIVLVRTSVENIRARQKEGRQRGKPQYYARYGNSLVVYPVADKAYTVTVVGEGDPSPLSNEDERTPFHSTWDNAVHMFAAAQAFFDLGEDERGLFWFDRAVRYAGSRKTDAEMPKSNAPEPVRVVHTRSDLMRMRGNR